MNLYQTIYDILKPIVFGETTLITWQEQFISLFTMVIIIAFSYLILSVFWRLITYPFRR